MTKMENKNNELDFTIRFIEETKNGIYANVSIPDQSIATRSDEPSIYANDPEEIAFISFCN